MSDQSNSGVKFDKQTTTIQSTTTKTKIDVPLPSKKSENQKVCSQEQVDKRLSICHNCEYYENNTCLQCGCALSRERVYMNKLYLANQSCPIGKWGPENIEN